MDEEEIAHERQPLVGQVEEGIALGMAATIGEELGSSPRAVENDPVLERGRR